MKIPFLYDIERNIRKIRKFGLLETITNILSDLTIIKKAICENFNIYFTISCYKLQIILL